MSKKDKAAVLAQVPLFSKLSQRQLNAVADSAEPASFDAGTALVKELDVGQRIIIILEGTAAVMREGVVKRPGSGGGISKGSSRRLATVGPGEVIGELSIIDGAPTSASVIAETPIEALVISRTSLIKLFDTLPQLSRNLLVALAGRLRAADHRADLIS